MKLTNEEAKQEAIRKAWEDAGLIWAEISKYVSKHSGILMIGTPDLKKTITGYDEFIASDKHGVWFSSGGLHILLNSIKEIFTNNGWTRISGPENLPKEAGVYTVFNKSEKIENWSFETAQYSIDFWLEYFTHWRPVEEMPRPIY